MDCATALQYEDMVLDSLEEIGVADSNKFTGIRQAYKPFKGLTKLPIGRIYVIQKVVIRRKGEDGASFNAVLLETNEFATALPQRVAEKLMGSPHMFEIFGKKTKLFKFIGWGNCVKSSHRFSKISFPRIMQSNGCLCEPANCELCKGVCSLLVDRPCPCWSKHDIANMDEFLQMVKERRELPSTTPSSKLDFYSENSATSEEDDDDEEDEA